MAEPGAVVAWWDGDRLAFAVVAGQDKGKLRLILEDGSERKIPQARVFLSVEPSGEAPGRAVEQRRHAGKRAALAAKQARDIASGIDVPVLWQLALDENEAPDTATLALLALGDDRSSSLVALVQALLDDRVHFVRKGERWEPRTREAVSAIRVQRARDAEREQSERAALDAMRAAVRGEAYVPTGSREERRRVEALVELAVLDRDAPDRARALALETLEKAGQTYDRPEEGAFLLLRRLGHFDSDDENLHLRRLRLRPEFPEAVVRGAREAARRGFLRDGREDLTGLEVITVDGPDTREIDDALSVESMGGKGVRLGIHIADPAAFVEPDDPVDREARARALTHYLPDCRIPMLPPVISEEAASLVQGLERPATSFLVELDASGELAGSTVVRSVVRTRARLVYEDADRALVGSRAPWSALLRQLEASARVSEAARIRSGAVMLSAPEVDVKVNAAGDIRLERIDPASPARRIVSESMILAGVAAARFCTERGLPAIFRRQSAPESPIDLLTESVSDPVVVRRARRALRRGEVSIRSGPHFALGVPAYAQATSPLRRYQDLATHRQIACGLGGRPPAHDEDALQRIAASTERAEAEARRAESSSKRYWLLRHLERSERTVRATVVELEPRPVVLLDETLLEQPVPALASVSEGDRVLLRVERVNPRADLLVLRPEISA